MEHSLNIFGKKYPKAELTYVTQVLVILILILTAIFNLSFNSEHHDLWLGLLCSAAGLILPAPFYPRKTEKEELNTIEEI